MGLRRPKQDLLAAQLLAHMRHRRKAPDIPHVKARVAREQELRRCVGRAAGPTSHVLAAADDAVAQEPALPPLRLAVYCDRPGASLPQLEPADLSAHTALRLGATPRRRLGLRLTPIGRALLRLRDAGGIRLTDAGRMNSAAPVSEVRLPLLREARHRRRVAALVVDREVL